MTDRIETPCRQVCRLGGDAVCDGCGRTSAEIARWLGMTPAERGVVMVRVRDWRPRDPNSTAARG
ncbi:MAG: DUF1289 domain-containing protein [Gemmatimonadales bacterium]